MNSVLGTVKWSSELAYGIGLITTNGCLSKDGRHIELTSKDLEQIQNFQGIFKLKNKISLKKSSYNPNGLYYHVQFGNVKFYNFLLSIGLTSHKSKTLGAIKVPAKYFGDYLRGHLDGDGYTCSYMSNQYKNSLVFYTYFCSASHNHIKSLKDTIYEQYKILGRINFQKKSSVYRLAYAKQNSLILLRKIYQNKGAVCLTRKKDKIFSAIDI